MTHEVLCKFIYGLPIEEPVETINELQVSAKQQLEVLETQIKEGQAGWLKVAEALLLIRDKKLFGVVGFNNFKTYTSKRLQLGESKSYQLIWAFMCFHNLYNAGLENLPVNSYSIYTSLYRAGSIDDQIAVWKQALTTGKKITVALINKLIAERKGIQAPPKTHATVKVSLEVAEVLKTVSEQANISQSDFIQRLIEKVMG